MHSVRMLSNNELISEWSLLPLSTYSKCCEGWGLWALKSQIIERTEFMYCLKSYWSCWIYLRFKVTATRMSWMYFQFKVTGVTRCNIHLQFKVTKIYFYYLKRDSLIKVLPCFYLNGRSWRLIWCLLVVSNSQRNMINTSSIIFSNTPQNLRTF